MTVCWPAVAVPSVSPCWGEITVASSDCSGGGSGHAGRRCTVTGWVVVVTHAVMMSTMSSSCRASSRYWRRRRRWRWVIMVQCTAGASAGTCTSASGVSLMLSTVSQWWASCCCCSWPSWWVWVGASDASGTHWRRRLVMMQMLCAAETSMWTVMTLVDSRSCTATAAAHSHSSAVSGHRRRRRYSAHSRLVCRQCWHCADTADSDTGSCWHCADSRLLMLLCSEWSEWTCVTDCTQWRWQQRWWWRWIIVCIWWCLLATTITHTHLSLQPHVITCSTVNNDWPCQRK